MNITFAIKDSQGIKDGLTFTDIQTLVRAGFVNENTRVSQNGSPFVPACKNEELAKLFTRSVIVYTNTERALIPANPPQPASPSVNICWKHKISPLGLLLGIALMGACVLVVKSGNGPNTYGIFLFVSSLIVIGWSWERLSEWRTGKKYQRNGKSTFEQKSEVVIHKTINVGFVKWSIYIVSGILVTILVVALLVCAYLGMTGKI